MIRIVHTRGLMTLAAAVTLIGGTAACRTTTGTPGQTAPPLETGSATASATAVRWIGKKAARFVLPDAHGKSVSVGKMIGSRPVVLVFYRGVW